MYIIILTYLDFCEIIEYVPGNQPIARSLIAVKIKLLDADAFRSKYQEGQQYCKISFYHNKHSNLGWLGYCSDIGTDCRKSYGDHGFYIKRHDTMLTNQLNPIQEINSTLESSLW